MAGMDGTYLLYHAQSNDDGGASKSTRNCRSHDKSRTQHNRLAGRSLEFLEHRLALPPRHCLSIA